MTDNDDKIQELEQKIARLKSADDAQNKPVAGTPSLATKIITDLVAGLFVGAVIGYFLDEALNSSPLFLLIFLIIGMAAGFMNIYRGLNDSDSENKS